MPTATRDLPLPPYARIKQHIVEQIDAGRWTVNDQVPSENQLAAQFEVSRMTARRAILELTQEGILVRSQGLGTFVAEQKPALPVLEVRNIAEEIAQRGHRYANRVLQLERVTAPEGIATALALSIDKSVYHSLILHLDNDVPVQLEDRYVNPRVAPDYIDQDFSRETPNAYLSRVAPLTAVEHTIEAILPDARVAGWLELKGPQACLQVLRRTWSGDDVVTFARLIHPGDRYRLTGHAVISTRSATAKISGDQAQ
ncbi:histidine utilization repressor [Bordetella bronchialis]|uniref:Histidine utilization repressor n=1 Tax=Bordetella bronchialis TaxID=463025 RepID=A0A193FZZ9_9BORD|nr:histidine utilization repressor [Bordetella bronchialis]ANN67475.1 histidine utilization repressor [Bordetella bronchialis]ANN72564.1 histidine utilization repressor [Bordetella bronchialis]